MLQRRHASPSPFAEKLETADIATALFLAQAKDSAPVRALGTVSEVGGSEMLLALSVATWAGGVLLGDTRMAKTGRRMLAAGILASAAKTTTKRLVHRTRPSVLMDTGVYARGPVGTGYGPWQSFPSGHAALTAAVAGAAVRAYPNLRSAAYAGAAGITITQLLRGSHYPSDFIVGSLIGFAAEATTNAFAMRHHRPREQASPA